MSVINKDIDLEKVRCICEIGISSDQFYEKLRQHNVAIRSPALPILAPVIRALCLAVFRTLSDTEVRYFLSSFLPLMQLDSIPIRSLEVRRLSNFAVLPRVHALAVAKLYGLQSRIDFLVAKHPELDFSAINCEMLPEMATILELMNRPAMLDSLQQPLTIPTIATAGEPSVYTESTPVTLRQQALQVTQEAPLSPTQEYSQLLTVGQRRNLGLTSQLSTEDAQIHELLDQLEDSQTGFEYLTRQFKDNVKNMESELKNGRKLLKQLHGAYTRWDKAKAKKRKRIQGLCKNMEAEVGAIDYHQ